MVWDRALGPCGGQAQQQGAKCPELYRKHMDSVNLMLLLLEPEGICRCDVVRAIEVEVILVAEL